MPKYQVRIEPLMIDAKSHDDAVRTALSILRASPPSRTLSLSIRPLQSGISREVRGADLARLAKTLEVF